MVFVFIETAEERKDSREGAKCLCHKIPLLLLLLLVYLVLCVRVCFYIFEPPKTSQQEEQESVAVRRTP